MSKMVIEIIIIIRYNFFIVLKKMHASEHIHIMQFF